MEKALSARRNYIVEIKRRKNISADIVPEFLAKCKALVYDDSLSMRTALIYDGELAPAIKDAGIFDFVIPLEKLL